MKKCFSAYVNERIIWGTKDSDVDEQNDKKKEEEIPVPPKLSILSSGSLADLVCKENNHLYFYDEVSKKSALKFMRLLRQIDEEQQLKKMKGEIDTPIIHIHISSGGGSLLYGFSMASTVIATKSQTTTYGEAFVASAATLPLVVGNQRRMQPYCYVLIHQLSASCWGTYENFKDNQANLDSFMSQIVRLYLKYTKVPETEIRDILKHDVYWNADKCMEYGIVDEVN